MLNNTANVIAATILTGIYDVNRSQMIAEDDFTLVRDWYTSMEDNGLNGIIFHNCFSEATVQKYQTGNIAFSRVAYNSTISPNAYRYIIYNRFLQHAGTAIQNIFFTDIADVVAVKNPFIQPEFNQHPNTLFCGDEDSTLDNEWMNNHSTFLRQHVAGYTQYEADYKNEILLNCGVFGGNAKLVASLVSKLANLHLTYTIHNKTPFTLDMGAFNFIVRTQFGTDLIHGMPVNTVFKKYEHQRMDCWFRHK